MIAANKIITICNNVIERYHQASDKHPDISSDKLSEDNLSKLIELKSWIDTIQWHLEDEVRSPKITAEEGWEIKKEIDTLNQKRTDTVEKIDLILFNWQLPFNQKNTELNSETAGWIIDRLSILCLKIYHMREETLRIDVDDIHISNCKAKLAILLEQQKDLSLSFDKLISDLENGIKYMKRYLQMKMYNDEKLNPVLYKNKM